MPGMTEKCLKTKFFVVDPKQKTYDLQKSCNF
jgi:hypothetical protein